MHHVNLTKIIIMKFQRAGAACFYCERVSNKTTGYISLAVITQKEK